MKPNAGGILMTLRAGLRVATNAVAAIIRRRSSRRSVHPERFGAFGEGSTVETPFRILSPECVCLGREVKIRPNAWFSVVRGSTPDGDPLLSIGDRAQLGGDLVIACAEHVEIGPDVLISERVFIGDTYHQYRDVERPIHAQGLAAPKPVRVGSGAFIGIGAIVLPGVTIGENSCIGAGAVVTQDVPARSVAVGNPARVVSHWDSTAREWRSGPSLAARSVPT